MMGLGSARSITNRTKGSTVGTLAEADQELRARAAAALDGATISADPPRPAGGSAPATATLSLYLLELAGERELQAGRGRNPLRYVLRYLVTADGPDRAAAAELLGQLLDAAAEDDDLTLQLDPPAPELWLALGAPPQPSFQLEVAARVTRRHADAPLVTEPLVVDGSVLRTVHGRLVGPEGRTIPGATVAIDGTTTRVHTGRDGSFHIPAAPGPDGRARFRVTAKGREFLADVALDDADDHLVIHFDPRET